LTFEERLGSMADRSDRIQAIALDLAADAGLTESESTTLAQAARLAKFDLASEMKTEPRFQALTTALQRVQRILPPDTPSACDPDQLSQPAELRLHGTLSRIAGTVDGTVLTIPELTDALTPLVDPVNRFFDDVLVMDPDPGVRAARLGLLAMIYQLAKDALAWDELT
jgi:glycyl-tRNA synthetase